MNAAAYARFSSDNQREESIDAQLRAINQYAERNSLTITNVYTDYATSARTDQRPEFQRMVADAKTGMFDAIVFHKLDRFSRNMLDWLTYERELRAAGVKLYSVSEIFDDSSTGRLMINIKGSVAQWQSDNLAEEVMKGLKENAYNGLTTGGRVPLGFSVVDKKFVINELEAEAVRQMFRMYAEGASYRAICEELNNKGYRSKAGGLIQHTAVFEMLRNRKYNGVLAFNVRPDITNSRKRNNDEHIIKSEGAIPKLIDDKTWAAVQARFKTHKNGTNKAKRVYLLSGLLECGECGAALCGNTRKSAKGNHTEYSSYICNNRRTTVKCSLPGVRCENIEKIVIDDLAESIFNDKAALAIARQLLDGIAQERDDKQKAADLSRQIKEIDRKINNIVNAIAEGIASSALKEQLISLECQKTALADELRFAKAAAVVKLPSEKQIAASLMGMKPALYSGDPQQVRRILTTYIKKVVVFADHVEVVKVIPSVYIDGLGERT